MAATGLAENVRLTKSVTRERARRSAHPRVKARNVAPTAVMAVAGIVVPRKPACRGLANPLGIQGLLAPETKTHVNTHRVVPRLGQDTAPNGVAQVSDVLTTRASVAVSNARASEMWPKRKFVLLRLAN